MGIRFFCPKGHKLNVKSFLAGKTGFCPYCNARVDIPLNSTRESSRAKLGEGQDDEPVDDIPLAQPAPVAKPVDTVQGSVPVAMPVPSPTSAATNQPAAPATGPLETRPATVPQGQLPSQREITAAVPDKVVSQPTPRSEPSPPAGPTSFVQEPTATAPDPITEAPDAVWYVRPEAGGQFGPASAAVMRQWLDEGRVAADSLVWREGWSDWQSAETAFPTLRR